jgi:hypothetical protein
MRKAFLIATPVGILCILLFSFVGVYAHEAGLTGSAPVAVARHFGMVMMLCMNFMMVTSAASTLDSALSSFAKLTTVDLGKDTSLKKGRWSMASLSVLGTIPVFLNPEILSATTVSGTMVVGLAPVMIFWNLPVRKIAFHLSVGFGLLMGLVLAFGLWPEAWSFAGKYGDLLAVNLVALVGCLGLFLLTKKRNI